MAFGVAASVKRQPPDFAALPPIAVVRDAARHPLWTLRLALGAHQIAVDAVSAEPPPAGHAYQLWLASPAGAAADARSLGLMPASGRKVIAEIPALTARLAGRGELVVTLEPAGGSDRATRSGPVVFRAALSDARAAAPVARP